MSINRESSPSKRSFPTTAMVGAGETRQLLSALVRLASELNSSLDLPTLLETVMKRARDVMNAEASSLMFLDPSKTVLTYEVALSEVGETLKESCSVPVGQGIAGHVAATGQPYLCNEPYKDNRFSRSHDDLTGFQTRSILCVPLQTQDGLIGVAQVLNRHGSSGFSPADVELFQAFADLAAVAISNARLHLEAIQMRRMEKEMAVARDIQQSFLPSDFPASDWLTFDGIMKPARQVGGDFYDFFPLKTGQTAVVIGDVSGKGTSAALYMACLHSELRMTLDYEACAASAFQRLNTIMFGRSQKGAFVTLLLLLFNPADKLATILSAGHPPPLLFNPDTQKTAPLACENGFPLGVVPDAEYIPTTFAFPPGSRLFAFTDGVLEARDESGEDFGLDRTCHTLNRLIENDQPLIQGIYDEILQYQGSAPQYDDLTMVTVVGKE